MSYSFEHVDTKDVLVEGLKRELRKFGINIRVLKGDPAAPAEVPCIGLNRLDDTEANQVIADMAGDHYDKDTKTYYKTFGSYFQESIEVRIWHTNANERDHVYRHTKAVLMALRTELVEKGLMNITMRTGRDEQDTSGAQAPMAIYWATLTVNALNPMDVTFEEVAEPITAVPVNEGGVLDG